MPTPSFVHRPDETTRGAWQAALPLLIPPVAWLASLGLSWLLQDFTCTASATAGAPAPETALLLVLMGMNAVLLLITVVSGFFSVRALRAGHRARAPLMSFLGLSGCALAVLFGFGIVLIMAMPLVLEVC
ncbi:hypothetical protein GCM10010977_08410 [Citricoccus zhacaiensis]|uniref:Uncharacterized protein n=1 Tax=Citricoccus zhacaiensis TaxID=489142 RepID=A0ABQ2LS14_9MICC|nr:hypothetical protein [Citricoccus zhacaiensis]GGO42484.1 hypothetical protein GCM10010977_08410 [Citricoccus zhacaiensis]